MSVVTELTIGGKSGLLHAFTEIQIALYGTLRPTTVQSLVYIYISEWVQRFEYRYLFLSLYITYTCVYIILLIYRTVLVLCQSAVLSIRQFCWYSDIVCNSKISPTFCSEYGFSSGNMHMRTIEFAKSIADWMWYFVNQLHLCTYIKGCYCSFYLHYRLISPANENS